MLLASPSVTLTEMIVGPSFHPSHPGKSQLVFHSARSEVCVYHITAMPLLLGTIKPPVQLSPLQKEDLKLLFLASTVES